MPPGTGRDERSVRLEVAIDRVDGRRQFCEPVAAPLRRLEG
ncbi:hypothetical protein [Natrinema soli]|nr:hypothetical protein [Natrinema soli]